MLPRPWVRLPSQTTSARRSAIAIAGSSYAFRVGSVASIRYRSRAPAERSHPPESRQIAPEGRPAARDLRSPLSGRIIARRRGQVKRELARVSRRAFVGALCGATAASGPTACLPENQPTPTAKPAAAAPTAAAKPEEKPAAGAQPAAAKPSTGGATTTNLVSWFTNRLTINQMTEKEAKPEFEGRNP